MKRKAITTINPIVTSLGDSSVDEVEVLLSTIDVVVLFLLMIDDVFLGGSVLGVLALILPNLELTSCRQVTIIVDSMSIPIHSQ